SGYETVRERFIGLYRNENNPEAVELDRLSNQDTDFSNAIGALKFEIELQPGEKKEIVINLGIIAKTEFSDKKKSVVERFQNVENVAQSFVAVKQSWEKILSSVKVTTPDRNTNIFLNYWTPYQARVAFDIGRVASFYYWGISRGFGFRDTAQDVLAVSISDPEKARERILLLARQMFSSGRVFHHFYKDGQGETTRHCDDPLWFIFAVTEYLKETGDMEIVNRVEPFVDQKSGTILDHLKAVLQFVKNNLGAHHLPVFGRGDWNDTLDYIGGDDGGESVWGGMFYVVMLNDLIELLSVLQETITRQEAEKLCNMIRDSINKNCWDGDWFIRAFGDNGKKIGSKSNKYGKIFLNPQAWAVLGNVAEKGKLQKAMASARHHLDTEFGPKICVPAFREIDPAIGLVTRCVAGKKENGAVFYHPTTWAIQAECLLGHGDIAYQYYRKLLPNSIDSDRFQTEPYVYPQYITSDEHPTAGMASHSWQTGTAAWMYRVAIDYMLGVRATYQGLLIDPVIPSHWPEFSMERIYRGTRYMIHVVNPDHVERGIKEIVVDGRKVKTAVLAISNRKICSVDVVMG
ncbi:MAG TPA: glycosyl transferase family 36, partial [Bacteroidetes bacterium]|nr:glycosyl transferase family 36 [Bacteroidota bacterium]